MHDVRHGHLHAVLVGLDGEGKLLRFPHHFHRCFTAGIQDNRIVIQGIHELVHPDIAQGQFFVEAAVICVCAFIIVSSVSFSGLAKTLQEADHRLPCGHKGRDLRGEGKVLAIGDRAMFFHGIHQIIDTSELIRAQTFSSDLERDSHGIAVREGQMRFQEDVSPACILRFHTAVHELHEAVACGMNIRQAESSGIPFPDIEDQCGDGMCTLAAVDEKFHA